MMQRCDLLRRQMARKMRPIGGDAVVAHAPELESRAELALVHRHKRRCAGGL